MIATERVLELKDDYMENLTNGIDQPDHYLEIPLTQGKTAKVSVNDFERIMQYKWCYNNGYAVRTVKMEDGKTTMIRMHREIMNPPTGHHVDHINHDKLDNRRENLRICTPSQNHANSLKKWNASSKFKGVCLVDGRWRAYIKFQGKLTVIGHFLTEIEAAEAYDRMALALFHEYALPNFSSEICIRTCTVVLIP